MTQCEVSCGVVRGDFVCHTTGTGSSSVGGAGDKHPQDMELWSLVEARKTKQSCYPGVTMETILSPAALSTNILMS